MIDPSSIQGVALPNLSFARSWVIRIVEPGGLSEAQSR